MYAQGLKGTHVWLGCTVHNMLLSGIRILYKIRSQDLNTVTMPGFKTAVTTSVPNFYTNVILGFVECLMFLEAWPQSKSLWDCRGHRLGNDGTQLLQLQIWVNFKTMMVSLANHGHKVSSSPYCGHFFQLHTHKKRLFDTYWELSNLISNSNELWRLSFQVSESELRCKVICRGCDSENSCYLRAIVLALPIQTFVMEPKKGDYVVPSHCNMCFVWCLFVNTKLVI